MSSPASTVRRRSPELVIAILIGAGAELVTFGGLVVAVWLIGERPGISTPSVLPSWPSTLVGAMALVVGSVALRVLGRRQLAFLIAALCGGAVLALGLRSLVTISAQGGFGLSTHVDAFIVLSGFHLLHVGVLVGLFGVAIARPPSDSGDFALSAAWYVIALLYIPVAWTFAQ